MTGQERQQQTEATVWTTAVRQRVAELRRHPGHDGPTVCACAECVLAYLLNAALNEVEFWHKEATGEHRAHDKTAARLSGLQKERDNLLRTANALDMAHTAATEALSGLQDTLAALSNRMRKGGRTAASWADELDAALALNADGEAT